MHCRQIYQYNLGGTDLRTSVLERDLMSEQRSCMTRYGAALSLGRSSALALLFCTPTLFGQHLSRNLTGTVSDRHEPLRGAVVQVENEATNSVVSYVTDRTGQYSFKRLEVDTDYRVSVSYRGRRAPIKELSHFDKKQTKVMNFVIKDQ